MPLLKKIPLKYSSLLGVSFQAINKWNRGLTKPSIRDCIKIHEISGGKIRVVDVRPELKELIPYMIREFAEYLKKFK